MVAKDIDPLPWLSGNLFSQDTGALNSLYSLGLAGLGVNSRNQALSAFGWSDEPTLDKFTSEGTYFPSSYLGFFPDTAGWRFKITSHCGFIIRQKKWICKGFVEGCSFVGFVIMETEDGDQNSFRG